MPIRPEEIASNSRLVELENLIDEQLNGATLHRIGAYVVFYSKLKGFTSAEIDKYAPSLDHDYKSVGWKRVSVTLMPNGTRDARDEENTEMAVVLYPS